ncbi:hypothetical protein Tco_1305016, partial [Tanacetum coccineum]
MALPPREQRHQWLRFDAYGYTEEEHQEYEKRLGEIDEGDVVLDMTKRLRMEHRGDDGEVMFISFICRDLLGPPPSYTSIREPLRRLCHRLIAFTVSSRGRSLEKVTTIDLFFLRSMDEGTMDVLVDQEDVQPGHAPQ